MQEQQQQHGAQQDPASPWREAGEEASLLSPMGALSSPLGSAAFVRSLSSTGPPRPGHADLWCARHDEAADAEAAGEAGRRWASLAREARNLSRLALPMSVTNLAAFSIGVVVLAAAGRLGSTELSCVVLGTSLFNVTGMSLLMGFTTAMETLAGQAYGARNFKLVGTVFQRALLLTSAMGVVVALVWTQAEPLLLFFRQDPLLARSAARYMQLTIPALFGQGVFEASKRYLLTQGVVRPQSVVTLAGLALAPLYSWLFIFRLDWRLDGAAYAVDAIQLTMAALLGLYCVARDAAVLRGLPHATWHGWSMDALRGWPSYLRFALPSVAMICCEWWTFEAMILMSGWLEQPDLTVAVMGILVNTSGIIWMFVTGFALACSTRVSNSLGAGCPRTARRATWVAVGIAIGLELAAMGAMLALCNKWALLFTDSAEVRSLTAQLLPIFALSLPGDGANAILQGLLRGSGRQETGAVTNLCSYWLLGIPAAAYFAFRRHLGIAGLWWGLVLVNTVQGSVMAVIALRFDFENEARKAVARTTAGDASIAGGSSADGLAEPLLMQGPQCERLEQGILLAEPAEASPQDLLAPSGCS
ncbi:hypothetical protein ABPG75_011525 [Micractinium tetrahymenae]